MFNLFKRSILNEPKVIHIAFGEERYDVLLKRSDRAKRLTLKMHPANKNVILTAPPRVAYSDLLDFAERHAGWIDARHKKMPISSPIQDGEQIPFKGKTITIHHLPQTRGNTWLVGNELHVGGDPIGLKRRVLHFLMSEAKRELNQASLHYAAELGVKITSITLRDTKTRWGSCSSLGSLNYSWRIIMAPPEVLNYLCAHEVCHRLEMNHSQRFWALVKQLYPNYKDADKWLKKNGAKLHLVN